MDIQWFPGHMTKSMRMIEENVKLCDGIVYVLDARAPFACVNKKLIKVFGGKPVVYVLNKSDLISSGHVSEIKSNFAKEGIKVIPANGTLKKDASRIYDEVVSRFSEKISKAKEKGINKTLRIMVAGVPNTGKSTVINSLCGEKRAVTGDKAGVTRGKQWIRLKDLELLDTPGTMPPKFDNQCYARHLAYIGSVNDAILDMQTLCLDYLGETAEKFPLEIKEKYGVDPNGVTPLEIFDLICRKRGFLFKGNEYDYERGARAVLDDFRKGRAGKICFETQRIYEDDDR